MKKLVKYGLDQYVIEWVLSFLCDRTQFTKVGTKISGMKAINLSIVQGSGVGPCLFIILISDLRVAGLTTHLVNYADDATILVPEIHSNSLEEEFSNVQKWAILNKLIINMLKTKKMVFHRPYLRCLVPPPPLSNMERVKFTKLLGVYISDTLGAGKQIEYMLKICNHMHIFLTNLRSKDCLRKNSIMFSIIIIYYYYYYYYYAHLYSATRCKVIHWASSPVAESEAHKSRGRQCYWKTCWK